MYSRNSIYSLENGLLCVWSHNCGSVKGERDIERVRLFPNIKEEKLSIPIISIDIREAITKNMSN